jgi:steroid 5-alpha reductase family enzyme
MAMILACALSLAALSVIMAGTWLIARVPGRSGWIDAIWSLAVGLVGAAAALIPLRGGLMPRQVLVAGMVALWALRLGGHIALRTAGHGDDPRYTELRREWGDRFAMRLFLFLQIQAFAAWLLVICMMLAAHRPAPFPVWSDGAGATLLIIAVAGEGLADAQLRAFRKLPANKGRICDSGLWGLSRHPNYFFEWLGWSAYALIAIGPDGLWWPGRIALSGPVFMYWLLVHVSGIPPLEAHMLRSRGEAYRRFQKRVSAFWPIPLFHRSGEAP